MEKLSWAKYIFSFWIVAILLALTAKYITTNVVILGGIAAVIFWLSLTGFSSTKTYR